MHELATIGELAGRAGSYAGLRFAVDTADPGGRAHGARRGAATAINNEILFVELEWAALDDDHADALLADDRLAFCRHYLASARRYRPHLLSEPEERILSDKALTATARGCGCSPSSPRRSPSTSTARRSASRRACRGSCRPTASPAPAAEAVTAALEPGLRTRAFVFNTLLVDKSIDDRLRHYASWIASRNLANEASDESVQALVDAVQARYDIPQRWYALKAQLLGLDRARRLRPHGVGGVGPTRSSAGARPRARARRVRVVLARARDGRATVLRRVVDRRADAAGQAPGAFCAYTVPSQHPYLLLNWTARRRDVLTLAHEMGHGLHAYLAREQGIFHQTTPLTLAETASVFGETVTFGRLLDATDDPAERLALLAESLEGQIATVFRQIAMNRFEDRVHTQRREEGELSVDQFNDAWAATQPAMLGDTVEITDGYRTWWSYIPHFMGTPGYVYAYAYGQLLALSVYRAYEERGDEFVPDYLELLAGGGSRSPEELGAHRGLDLADPAFWDGGLEIIEEQLDAAEAAATEAGRL